VTTLAACIVAASSRDRMTVARALADQHRAEATARTLAVRMAELRAEVERLEAENQRLRAVAPIVPPETGGDAA
jgi:hypothetical protein